jgi:hypothetical protein
MLDLAKHIVNQKSGRFEPDKFEDQYETALIDLINQKRSGKPITPKERNHSVRTAAASFNLVRSISCIFFLSHTDRHHFGPPFSREPRACARRCPALAGNWQVAMH